MTDAKLNGLDKLYATVASRKGADLKSSYTASLYSKGSAKIAQKVGEEAVELAIAATLEDRDEIISESADLLYHLSVLWANAGIVPADIYDKLSKREGQSGLTEKAARNSNGEVE
ncbi:phosphoribosyl-ATP diphosphatase [uncultured Sneathiella sp.]|jgi:phosphoribosyl-ATP pyrophosphohydrolase|uniref:phosphoribosyl-ATP diphosphatase n=1 Tax=uncultured Sneathiella sp. TaxID=879315 RepID=UPI0030D8EE3E|tara:strand:- start:8467 stop:8811 length:345 start_codon:yes stop_codon:yes gene_type:complete